MKITSITESGCNNILRWAMQNGADVKEDRPLQSIVNDELFYLLTIDEVNMFELFRLSQMYREKLRIIQESKADVPDMEHLTKVFNGSYSPNPEEPETKSNVAECAQHVIQNFINLALQMSNDSDIIKPSAVRLFLPMISRKFTVQVPVSFIDLIDSITPEESAKLFSSDYPATLQEIVGNNTHGFNVKFSLAFIQATWIIKYDKRYDQYIKITKYSALKNSTVENNKLYKVGLLGFSKYNNITRGLISCNLFNSNASGDIQQTMKQLKGAKTPLKVQFAVQLPIQYMQILENTFSREELDIAYESSMANIIDSGIVYNDFETPVAPDEDAAESVSKDYENKMNNISAYKVRITEANQLTLNVIDMLLNNDGDIDVSSAFALLPSIYTTRAILTIDTSFIDKYSRSIDPVIDEMFEYIFKIINGINNDMNNA